MFVHCIQELNRRPLFGCSCYDLAQKKQSSRFLECMEDNFLMQMIKEPTRGAAPLDLLFTNREGLVGDVEVGSCLGQSDHNMVEYSILDGARRGNSKTATWNSGEQTLNFQKTSRGSPLGFSLTE